MIAQVLLERGRSADALAGKAARELAEHGFAVQLHDQHTVAGVSCSAGQNRRYRGLADTAFARHDRHP